MPAAVRKVALTDRSLKALKPAPGGKRTTVWDAMMPGLAVRVTDKGRLSFVAVRRRPGQAQPTWNTLGEYPAMSLAEARRVARDALGDLAAGKDPRQAKKAQRLEAETFGAVAEQFIRRYEARGLRRGAETAATIRRELIPAWHDRPIASIAHRDIIDVIEAIRDQGGERAAPGSKRKAGGPYAARHVLAAARLVFGWAFRRDAIAADPCARIKAVELHGSPEARDRVLDNDELRIVWAAADQASYPFGPLVCLLLLTGARLREVAEASWGEIDLDAETLTVPTSRMKGKVAHVVPLCPAALAIVRDLPRFAGGDYLFSTTAGLRPISGFSKFKANFDRAVATIPAWTLHDLRRTCRTGLSSLGVLPVIAELVIGHKQQGIAKVYDLHRYDDEKRAALLQWEERLLTTSDPTSRR